ncbi:phage neck terminator protein [Burkholderia multivorans]|uniref:phage neck terminator protein n=1 Tax=Burkholderia multivorans TaxID=87883 RepID=UPI0006673DC8|nr:hypothetical protein [Burkholderia multivorans]
MATISITESNVLTALRTFILPLVSCEVIKGLVNRAAMPAGDFVAMTPVMAPPLATNVSTYSDVPGAGAQNVKRSTRFDVQIDCYGATSAENAAIISTLLRSEYACQSFKASGFDVQPLYADDPKQMPIVDDSDQWLERWTFSAVLQYNPVVTVPQDFAATLNVNLVNVDASYKP